MFRICLGFVRCLGFVWRWVGYPGDDEFLSMVRSVFLWCLASYSGGGLRVVVLCCAFYLNDTLPPLLVPMPDPTCHQPSLCDTAWGASNGEGVYRLWVAGPLIKISRGPTLPRSLSLFLTLPRSLLLFLTLPRSLSFSSSLVRCHPQSSSLFGVRSLVLFAVSLLWLYIV